MEELPKPVFSYITIGNETVGMLRKQIIVEQEQPTSSNCYIVGDGEHELIVTINGNGTKGHFWLMEKLLSKKTLH